MSLARLLHPEAGRDAAEARRAVAVRSAGGERRSEQPGGASEDAATGMGHVGAGYHHGGRPVSAVPRPEPV